MVDSELLAVPSPGSNEMEGAVALSFAGSRISDCCTAIFSSHHRLLQQSECLIHKHTARIIATRSATM